MRGNQIVEHSSENKTVLGTSWKLEGAAENSIDGSEKCTCRLNINYLFPVLIFNDWSVVRRIEIRNAPYKHLFIIIIIIINIEF